MPRPALAVLLIVLVASCCILPSRDAGCCGSVEARGPAVTITGRPVIKGNEPFTYVCIQAADGKTYYVHPQSQRWIRSLEPRAYRFYGRLHTGPPASPEARRYPNGTIIVEKWEPLGGG